MTAAIEAKSLSTVLSIADDPPKNPRDGAGLLQEQLVLYIARIPGSRGMRLLHQTCRTTLTPFRHLSDHNEALTKGGDSAGCRKLSLLRSPGQHG